MFIDCTGTAILGVPAGAQTRFGTDPDHFSGAAHRRLLNASTAGGETLLTENGSCSDGLGGGIGEQVQRDVDDEVFLSADQSAAADLEQDGARVQSIPLGRCLRMAQER
ncbi:hypothetical protein NONO_c51410 [Nocardia nova SH22a]|uniref:Uncharacterized protein n=1 Tax=Nocardia nova SH22a TaxID=1415166 RepID=W5TKQ9_9NOCA|nr:hypothetical protein NONO_c51410 [Nocardia nova SH22a]